MTITLSSDEMLAQWKLRRGFAPLRTDCVLSRSDGVDLDALLRLEMRDWYLNLLDTAPTRLLSLTSIADEIAIMAHDDNTATVTLPKYCRRLVEFQLDGWTRPATITTPDTRLARLQDNRFSRGGCESPVVVCHSNRLRIYSLPSNSTPTIIRAIAVMEPANGNYEMDESALATISKIENTLN